MNPNLQQTTKHVERPGESHEGVGRKKIPMAGEIQAELNSHTAGVSDIHAWGLMLPSSS